MSHTETPSPVSVLGLGPMGQALAGAFLARGHPTTIWNRTPGKGDELVARGAVLAATAAEAVRASDLIVVCVIDDDAAQAILGPVSDELEGRTVVNLTSDAPERARALASWAGERGLDYLDGAIMTPTTTIGGPSAVVLYSGPPEVYEAHRPTLAALGGRADHLGTDPGRAAAYDVALLDIFWTAMSGFVHALALAAAEGIAARDLVPYATGIVDILPPIMAELAERTDDRRHSGASSTIVSAVAGMDHIVHVAGGHGLDVGILTAAADLARRAVDSGHGNDDFSRLVELVSRNGSREQ